MSRRRRAGNDVTGNDATPTTAWGRLYREFRRILAQLGATPSRADAPHMPCVGSRVCVACMAFTALGSERASRYRFTHTYAGTCHEPVQRDCRHPL
jgi:hypothetical protein